MKLPYENDILTTFTEEIRKQFSSVDEFISSMKQIVHKAPYRIALFKSIAQDYLNALRDMTGSRNLLL